MNEFFSNLKLAFWMTVQQLPFYHKHDYKLKYTTEEVWAECSCGKQLDIPDERLYEAYSKLRACDLFWEVR